MYAEYYHVPIENFPVQITEWSESMRGRTYKANNQDPGYEIVVLSGQNEYGPVMAMFQMEQHGLYHYYRNLCGSARDFDTRDKVVDLIRAALFRNVKIMVDVTPRPQYSYRSIDGHHCRLIAIEQNSKLEYVGVVETHVVLDDKGSGFDNSVIVKRRVAIRDLTLRNVIEPAPEKKEMAL